jgi:membrane protein
MGVLLLASLFTSVAIAAAARFAPHYLRAPEILLETANFAAAMVFLTLLFGLIYRILPDTTVLWRDAWTGAAVTAFLFSVGKTLIGLYLGYATSSSAYGAAGSLVVLLLWVYYSSQIFLFGAEFTEVCARNRRV